MQQKLCECGCGQPTPLYKTDCNGNKKGEPARFVPGHWNRGRKHNRASIPAIDRALGKLAHYANDENCWPWAGYMMRGRPQIVVDGEDVSAVRIIYEDRHGPLGEAEQLYRRCGYVRCCNPSHYTTGGEVGFHGTLRRHKSGCRCVECEKAYSVREVIKRGGEGVSDRDFSIEPLHGTTPAFLLGCRCNLCSESEHAKELRGDYPMTAGLI